MNILLITASFYPTESPIAFRWQLLAREFATSGHRVLVLCAPPAGQPASSFTWQGMQIIQVGHASLPDALGLLKPQSDTPSSDTRNSGLKTLHNLFWKSIWWPDSSNIWYLKARKKAIQLLEKYPIDRFYSVALPFTSHLVGLHLKRRFPAIPWYADTEDPLSIPEATFVNNRSLYRSLNRWLEKRILKKADQHFVTTTALAQHYRELWPAVNLAIVPPIMEMKDYFPAPVTKKEDGIAYRMVYFGSLIPKVREPDKVIAFLSRFFRRQKNSQVEISFDFFGSVTEEHEAEIREATRQGIPVHHRGLLPKSEVQKMMRRYNFLINIGNNNPYQLPSKLAEYIALGKPIINFIQIPEDTSARFLTGHPYCLNLPLYDKDWEKLLAAFCVFLQEHRGRQLSAPIRSGLLGPFSPSAVAGTYLDPGHKKMKS